MLYFKSTKKEEKTVSKSKKSTSKFNSFISKLSNRTIVIIAFIAIIGGLLLILVGYLNQIRNFKTQDKKCQKCKFFNFCNGGCPAYNLYKNNSMIEKGDDRCVVTL